MLIYEFFNYYLSYFNLVTFALSYLTPLNRSHEIIEVFEKEGLNESRQVMIQTTFVSSGMYLLPNYDVFPLLRSI